MTRMNREQTRLAFWVRALAAIFFEILLRLKIVTCESF
jgi:hypothetical protein